MHYSRVIRINILKLENTHEVQTSANASDKSKNLMYVIVSHCADAALDQSSVSLQGSVVRKLSNFKYIQGGAKNGATISLQIF